METLTKTDVAAIFDHIGKMENYAELCGETVPMPRIYVTAIHKLIRMMDAPTKPKTAPVKYILVKYEERDGEHEYGDSLILKMAKKQNIPHAVHNYFKTMYGDNTETRKKADSYEESGGWRICTIDRFETIPEADALILAKHNTLMLDMTTRTTNHIVIVPEDKKDGQELFEDIQNKYSLYDNCVSEEDGKRIVIEGANIEEVQRLVERITKDFTPRIGAMDLERNLPMTDSIIDDGRDGETGGMEV